MAEETVAPSLNLGRVVQQLVAGMAKFQLTR